MLSTLRENYFSSYRNNYFNVWRSNIFNGKQQHKATQRSFTIKIHKYYDTDTFINDKCIIDLKSGRQQDIRLPELYFKQHENQMVAQFN